MTDFQRLLQQHIKQTHPAKVITTTPSEQNRRTQAVLEQLNTQVRLHHRMTRGEHDT